MGIFKQSIETTGEELYPYFYFLAETGVIGIKTYTRIQSYFASPKAFYEADESKLIKTGIFTKNQLEKIRIVKHGKDPFKEYERMKNNGISLIPFDSSEYPCRLKEIKDPPPVIFVKGKIPKENVPMVAVIGARECSAYGANIASRLGEVLGSYGVCVVSGMARGIDSRSQQACLYSGGTSLALLGGGVDVVYPKESQALYDDLCRYGGIISEFVPGTAPLRQYFAQRNRLISGLSDAVCVIEAKEKSGTMITVDCALDQGREVYAVPGRITDITSFGTNELIRNGAGIITDPENFAEEFLGNFSFSHPENRVKKAESADTCKNIGLNGLTDGELNILVNSEEYSFTADQMSEKCGLAAYEVLNSCVMLSSKGMLISMGGGRFKMTDAGIDAKNRLLDESCEKNFIDK